jgi:hypothetical protein
VFAVERFVAQALVKGTRAQVVVLDADDRVAAAAVPDPALGLGGQHRTDAATLQVLSRCELLDGAGALVGRVVDHPLRHDGAGRQPDGQVLDRVPVELHRHIPYVPRVAGPPDRVEVALRQVIDHEVVEIEAPVPVGHETSHPVVRSFRRHLDDHPRIRATRLS